MATMTRAHALLAIGHVDCVGCSSPSTIDACGRAPPWLWTLRFGSSRSRSSTESFWQKAAVFARPYDKIEARIPSFWAAPFSGN